MDKKLWEGYDHKIIQIIKRKVMAMLMGKQNCKSVFAFENIFYLPRNNGHIKTIKIK